MFRSPGSTGRRDLCPDPIVLLSPNLHQKVSTSVRVSQRCPGWMPPQSVHCTVLTILPGSQSLIDYSWNRMALPWDLGYRPVASAPIWESSLLGVMAVCCGRYWSRHCGGGLLGDEGNELLSNALSCFVTHYTGPRPSTALGQSFRIMG